MAEINVDLTALPQLTNPAFYPLYADKNRYLVLYGGAGSGKSVFAAQKLIVRTLAEPGHKFLIVRKVAKTLRHSTFALLRETIGSWGLSQLFRVNKTDMEIACPNGSTIIHAGLDDVEKLKSIHGVTGIWIEEASEITPEDFRQLDIRLRGRTKHYKQIILSFNPVSIVHWLKEEFFDKPKSNATTLHSTYKDNRFLDDAAKQVLEAFRDTDEYYYTVYCLGQWGVTGKTIFDAQKVSERLAAIKDRKPLREGFFAYETVAGKIADNSIRWVDEPGGYIRIYREPVKGRPYVIGGDTAGEGSDWFTGQVIDNISGEQVAVLRHRFDEDLYAKQMYCLGKHYGDALLSIETNFSTYPVKELERLGYPLQFMRQTEDTYTHKLVKRFGFRTDKLTRPVAIAGLVEVVRESVERINDRDTLEEMLTFVRNEKGKAEAQEGKHDDLIMALAIAYYGREQQRMTIQTPQAEADISKLPQDLQEDYNNATPEQRAYLLKKWGMA